MLLLKLKTKTCIQVKSLKIKERMKSTNETRLYNQAGAQLFLRGGAL